MSSCIDHVAPAAAPPPEQLCYIHCNFCNIVLAVSVPCSSLLDVVTVRCEHCTNVWSVNMAAAFKTCWPPQQQQHLDNVHQAENSIIAPNQSRIDSGNYSAKAAYNNMMIKPPPFRPSSIPNRTDERIVNRPPEKRQRVPSAYNQFIKEEIQRIKANNPDISHREAFSTAAKNWAHFPHIHFGLMLETNNKLPKLGEGSEKRLMPRTALLNK